MADFCKQCSIEIFGEDCRDLAGLITKEEVDKGLGVNALCEDCGIAWVDHEGVCHATDCLKHHGAKNGT